MAQEILSIKLAEMDRKIDKLHSRIQKSEAADLEFLRREITVLRGECEEDRQALGTRLRNSRSQTVAGLSESYEEITGIVRKATEEGGRPLLPMWQREMKAEEKTVLAEYALDAAMLTADLALLIAWEAIEAQNALGAFAPAEERKGISAHNPAEAGNSSDIPRPGEIPACRKAGDAPGAPEGLGEPGMDSTERSTP